MADIAILREQIGGRRHFRFIQCAISLVCPQLATLESFKNFETLIRKRRTLEETFNLAEFRRTNAIEVSHWAKVANESANINVQNRSVYAT